MTLATTHDYVQYNGNGATSVFAVTFAFYDQSELLVTKIASDGTETVQTLTTHYTVSGGRNSQGIPQTGSITIVGPLDGEGEVILPLTGEKLRIERITPIKQPTTYNTNDAFPAKTLESRLDQLTLMVQENRSRTNRSIKQTVTDYIVSGEIDFPSPTADGLIKWNGDADGLETVALADVDTISVLLPTVDNTIARFDGTGGNLQGSGVSIDDSGNVTGIVNLSQTGYHDLAELAAPSSPSANVARAYAYDDSSVTRLAYKDGGGTVYGILTDDMIGSSVQAWDAGLDVLAGMNWSSSVQGSGLKGLDNDRLFVFNHIETANTGYGGSLRAQVFYDYTGGSGVISSSTGIVDVAAGVTNLIYAHLDILNNGATAGENVSRYTQAFKNSTGDTWAAVFEADDTTESANPTGGLYAQEVDIVANGTDDNNTRRGQEIIGWRSNIAGADAQFAYGHRIGPSNDDVGHVVFKKGYSLTNNGGATAFQIGFDFSEATFSTTAIRLGAGNPITLDTNGNVLASYDNTRGHALLTHNTSSGNAVQNLLALRHTANATFAAGMGVGLAFESETADANIEIGGIIENVASNVGAGTEAFDYIYKLMTGGAAAAEKFRMRSSGLLTFGGVTSSQPALKPSSAALEARLADDSAYAVMRGGDAAADNDLVHRGYLRANAPFVIAKGTVSSAATLDIVLTSFAGLYRHIEMHFQLLPATDGTQLWLRFSTDGGSNYDTSGYNHNRYLLQDASGGVMIASSNGSDASIILATIIGNASTEGIGGTLTIYNPANSALWTRARFKGYYIDNTATPQGTLIDSGGARETAQDTDAFRLLFSSGDIASGSYVVLGLP